MDKRPIIEVNYGLASAYPDRIEINYKLQKDLRQKVIKHELKHKARNRHYKLEDFKNDFQSENSYFLESLKFCIYNPEALIGFFPLMFSYYSKKITWNTPAVFPYLYFGLIFSVFFWLLFSINFFLAILGFTILFTTINIILLVWTHIRVRRDKGFVYRRIN